MIWDLKTTESSIDLEHFAAGAAEQALAGSIWRASFQNNDGLSNLSNELGSQRRMLKPRVPIGQCCCIAEVLHQ